MKRLKRLRSLCPSWEQLMSNRWLARFRPMLERHPKLRLWTRKGVSTGIAVGVFFGLLLPTGQMPVAAGAAILLRANIPAAVGGTLVTNPVTTPPIYYVAYRLGSWIAAHPLPNHSAQPLRPPAISDDMSIIERIASIGRPLLLGLAVTATLAGLLVYAVITLVWRWYIIQKWRKRTNGR